MQSLKTRAIAALLLTMFLWGTSAVFMRTLAIALSPENSLALRYLMLIFINVAGLAYLGTWRIPRSDWLRFIVSGVAGMAGYNWFVNAGFELVPAGIGTLVTMVEPLMIAILAALAAGREADAVCLPGRGPRHRRLGRAVLAGHHLGRALVGLPDGHRLTCSSAASAGPSTPSPPSRCSIATTVSR